jgi:hypothetical protein
MYSSPTEGGDLIGINNAILARHRLYKGRAMPKDEATEFGIWAESIVDGQRFLIGCIDLSSGEQKRSDLVVSSWKKAGSVPMVLGGKFARQPGFHLTDYFTDPFAAPLTLPTQRILVTSHWRAPRPQPAATQPVSELIYIDLEPAK